MTAETVAYKILTAAQWAQFSADGFFDGAAVDHADGYIHLSTAAQCSETLDKHFAGQKGLMIAAMDLTMLGDVRWEPSRGGALFPHLYGGPLPMAAVISVRCNDDLGDDDAGDNVTQ